MKMCAAFLLLMLGILGPVGNLTGQPAFSSGSDGSYGEMNITNYTILDMPSNGVFHCTTINVMAGAKLRFNRNSLNTPVYLLATGDVVVNGDIDVGGEEPSNPSSPIPGRGGPGGFDGGFGGLGTVDLYQGGDGFGPGGGSDSYPLHGGSFVGTGSSGNKKVYGNAILVPLIGGSGGAGTGGNPGKGGGGGGGALCIASTTKVTIDGNLIANGARAGGGAGSGGAIRVISPKVSGRGALYASPAFSYSLSGTDGGSSYGRIRIDSADRYSYRTLAFVGVASFGSQMYVFPPGNSNRLEIVKLGDRLIPSGSQSGVSITLPAGPATNLLVTLQATGFTNDLPIRVVLTPENGPSSSYDTNIVMAGGVSTVNVAVNIPFGTISHLAAWTR